MLYITEISVPDRLANSGDNFTFGDVFQKTITIPAKIKAIKSFCAFAVLDSQTKMGHLETEEEGVSVKKELLTPQIGSVSLCMNKTDVIVAGSPLYSVRDLRQKSYASNKVDFSEQVKIQGGSSLTITIEEKEETPFVTGDLYYSYNEPRKNAYTVKIYLEYDK
ncbi:MAG: hypothetical protein MJ197_03565 [Bacteroidales bacterium]|nr:hypothetical protein [Bacteroidales bacterium]